jgi:hypothetical protein
MQIKMSKNIFTKKLQNNIKCHLYQLTLENNYNIISYTLQQSYHEVINSRQFIHILTRISWSV